MELACNRMREESPEYDVQQRVAAFYEDWLRNTGYSVKREKEGRFDIVVYQKRKICLLYEIKAYFKSNRRLACGPIESDVCKLKEKNDNLASECRKYILLAGKQQVLNKSKLTFVEKHLENDRSHVQLGGTSLRPSRKKIEIDGGCTFVMTWEVLDSSK